MLRNIKVFIKNIVRLFLSDDYLMHRAMSEGMAIGSDCRFYSYNFGSEPYLISFGDRVTVSNNVYFVTHDGGVWVFREDEPEIEVVAPIVIGDNVFIGLGSIILPGTTIANDVVIGAGSVVKGMIESGVYAGTPAKLICSIKDYRDRLDNVELLQSLDPVNKRDFYVKKFGL